MDVDNYRKVYAAEIEKRRDARLPAPASADASADSLTDAIASLKDATRSPSARLAALRTVQSATFLGPAFDPYRAPYRAALRAALADGDPTLRVQALALLAADKDDAAREVLLKGLSDDAQAVVPPAKAIQLLSQDDHGVTVPIARKLLNESDDVHVKEEALHALTAAPDAEEAFAQVLSDTAQPARLRSVGASGLRVINPQRFIQEARRIIADENENGLVRASCLGALAHLQGQGPAGIDPDLSEMLTKLAEQSVAEPLRAAAHRMLRRVSGK